MKKKEMPKEMKKIVEDLNNDISKADLETWAEAKSRGGFGWETLTNNPIRTEFKKLALFSDLVPFEEWDIYRRPSSPSGIKNREYHISSFAKEIDDEFPFPQDIAEYAKDLIKKLYKIVSDMKVEDEKELFYSYHKCIFPLLKYLDESNSEDLFRLFLNELPTVYDDPYKNLYKDFLVDERVDEKWKIIADKVIRIDVIEKLNTNTKKWQQVVGGYNVAIEDVINEESCSAHFFIEPILLLLNIGVLEEAKYLSILSDLKLDKFLAVFSGADHKELRRQVLKYKIETKWLSFRITSKEEVNILQQIQKDFKTEEPQLIEKFIKARNSWIEDQKSDDMSEKTIISNRKKLLAKMS